MVGKKRKGLNAATILWWFVFSVQHTVNQQYQKQTFSYIVSERRPQTICLSLPRVRLQMPSTGD
jgi:hypothetical protein